MITQEQIDKIYEKAGTVYYGVYTKDYEKNIFKHIINNPSITKKQLAITPISTRVHIRARVQSKIKNEYVAEKFIKIVRKIIK